MVHVSTDKSTCINILLLNRTLPKFFELACSYSAGHTSIMALSKVLINDP